MGRGEEWRSRWGRGVGRGGGERDEVDIYIYIYIFTLSKQCHSQKAARTVYFPQAAHTNLPP